MSDNIYVTKSSMPPFEQYVEEIRELWESGIITNNGVKLKKFEKELEQYLKVENVSLFVNGHMALESIIEAFDLKGEVITTPFTFASTTHAICRKGLTPVFCDINEDDYTIDVEKIESLITEKTSAIIPVHVYGNICNIEAIEKIAKKYGLKVIYDAAHCFGIVKNDVGVGCFGDASMFSFHATKVFNTIEGGAVSFNDDTLKDKLHLIKNFGISGEDNVDYIGTNGKMNEFQAAMGICNLKYIDENINKRKVIFERYIENLKNEKGIKLPLKQYLNKDVKSNYAYFPIVLDSYKKTREQLILQLKQENIYPRKYFYPITIKYFCYENMFSDNTPIAEKISNNVITLPIFDKLTIEQVDKICKIIKNN